MSVYVLIWQFTGNPPRHARDQGDLNDAKGDGFLPLTYGKTGENM